NGDFTITAPVHFYYVNDGSTIGDVFATATGDDANSGLSPSAPKASVSAVLNAYHLTVGDTILVDTGIYNLSTNILITSDDAGITIQGPTIGSGAVLDRADMTFGKNTIEVNGATDVTLDHLHITGGFYGVYATGTSSRLHVTNNQIYGNYNYGVLADP